MPRRSFQVLIVDDDEEDFLLTRDLFDRITSSDWRVDWVPGYESALQTILENRHDACLVDYYLGPQTGLDLVREARVRGSDMPTILLTGKGDYELDIEAMKIGVADYLEKSQLTAPLLERAVRFAIERSERLDALKDSEKRFRTMADTAPVMIWITDTQGQCTFFNRSWLAFTGKRLEEQAGEKWIESIHPDDRVDYLATRTKAVSLNESHRMEYRLRRSDGLYRWMLASAVPRYEADGSFAGYVSSCIDITDRREIEEQRAHMMAEVERSHDDMLSILNQLRQGIVMTDRDGNVTFLSRSCQQLIGEFDSSCLGRHWTMLCPFAREDAARLEELARMPPDQRAKLPVHLKTPTGEQYWMEVDLLDDPRDPQRKIFFIYDMTEVHDLRRMLDGRATFQDMIGDSQPMLVVYQQIRDLAVVDSTVLIEGETGTGKELVARAIHDTGPRAGKPFIPVNTAGLTDSLIASQLFGHRRGAFTGAVADHQGVFETAHGGTIFLDEIGDVPINVQTSLLRVLQEREITRLGESTPRKVDVRILAATHKNLDAEVAEGRFRMDLLYRIRVARITLPPLRQRHGDIPLLTETFLRQMRNKTGKPVEDISDEAVELLLQSPWPGNVRELQSAIEFAVVRCKGTVIRSDDLPPELRSQHALPPRITTDSTRPQERERLLAALAQTQGNRTAAARILGVSRATFYRRLEELQIMPD